MSTPLFTTEHSPVGAWASLSFGAAGKGVGIHHESIGAGANGDLLVAVRRGGETVALPFVEKAGDFSSWKFLGAEGIARQLTPCVDEFVAAGAGVTLRVFTPHSALPNPKRSGNLQYATVPAILMEVVIDNTGSDEVATAFVGVRYRGEGNLRPVDWSSKTLCGVGRGGEWLLAATPVKEEIFTVQSEGIVEALEAGVGTIDAKSLTGGIAIKVAARASRTVNLVLAFYDGGVATQGINGRYLYTAYFPRVEAVANFLLQNHQKIRESCSSLDGRARAACKDAEKLAVFAKAVRAYEAGTQLVDAEGVPYFSVIGKEGYRNVVDAAVDQLPWELFRNPWVIRNLFDLGTTSYSYHDKVKFASEGEQAGELREGGMTFAHDFGYGSCYSPAGTSVYEKSGRSGRGSFMATEELLNGAYLLTSYALLADDTPWAKTRLPFARELLTSMENRDHWDPEKRNGVLKAESEKVGNGAETTTFEEGVLGSVPGNVYLAVKTFCANLMLTTYFQNNNDLHSADYSYAFAQKTAGALVGAFDQSAQGGTGLLPANLVGGGNGEAVMAAIEPLAVPTYLGLTSTLSEYFPELFNVLKAHAMTCLKSCVDGGTGGLKMSSGGGVGSAAKVVSVLYVLERLFGVDVQGEYPGLWKAVLAGGEGIDGRAVSAAVFLKAPVAVVKEVEAEGGEVSVGSEGTT